MSKSSDLPSFLVGFFSGLWIAVGVDPQAEIFRVLGEVTKELSGISWFKILFLILPFTILGITVWRIYCRENVLGLIILAISFLGGILIIVHPIISVIFIMVGVLMEKYLF